MQFSCQCHYVTKISENSNICKRFLHIGAKNIMHVQINFAQRVTRKKGTTS